MKSLFKRYLDSYSGLSQESWMLSIVMLINRSGAMVIPFMGIYLHKELGFSIAESGAALSFYGIGSIAGSWLGGWLCDKIGNFKVQYLSLFLCAPLHFITPHFTSLEMMYLLLFALGVIAETFRPANSVAITKYAKKENITRAFSLNRMAVNLGFSIGPAVGGILSAYSFDLLFYINGVACTIAGIVFILFFRNRKERNEIEQTLPNGAEPIVRSPYTDTQFLLFTFFCAFYAITFFQLLNTLPLFLETGAGLSQKEVGLALGYSGLVIVLLEMPMVAIAERRLTIVQIMVWGTIVTGLSFFLYTISHSMFVIYVAITLMSIGEILVLPFMSTVTALRSGAGNKGAYMGVNGFAMGAGLIVSPFLGTLIVAEYGFNILWLGTAVVLWVAALGFKYTISPMKEVTDEAESEETELLDTEMN
jgi:predicted MFS family arabinose efflux permease